MGIFELLFGARKEHNGGETSTKLDALSARLRRIEELNKDSSHHIMRELREIKGSGTLNREEIVRRIDTVHEKLQLAVEDFVVSDEDVKQIIRNSLKSGAKTFNEIQKDTKVSPQALAKYLRMMKGEVEEFNGVYRIIYSSSFIYVGKGPLGSEEDGEFAVDLAKGGGESDFEPGP